MSNIICNINYIWQFHTTLISVIFYFTTTLFAYIKLEQNLILLTLYTSERLIKCILMRVASRHFPSCYGYTVIVIWTVIDIYTYIIYIHTFVCAFYALRYSLSQIAQDILYPVLDAHSVSKSRCKRIKYRAYNTPLCRLSTP